MDIINKQLFEKGFIGPEQFHTLEEMQHKKLISVYYELRIVLYLGILLFTGGVGYLVYENMGNMGHLISMVLLLAGIVLSFYFIQKHAQPYSSQLVEINHPYFDYMVLLAALLILSLFTYIIVYYDLADDLLNWSSLISAILFFNMAYRYDNKALLSMAITALAATVGLSISPVGWAKGELLNAVAPSTIGLVFASFLLFVSFVTHLKKIKRHFTFTYQNFGLLLFFFSFNAVLFDLGSYWIAMLIIASAAVVGYYSWYKKQFLFFLYAHLFGYIALSFLVIKWLLRSIEGDSIVFIFMYLITSSLFMITKLLKQKKAFADDEH